MTNRSLSNVIWYGLERKPGRFGLRIYRVHRSSNDFCHKYIWKVFLHHFPDTILLDISLYKTIYRGYTLIAPSMKLNTSTSEVIERDEDGRRREIQCIQEEGAPPLCQQKYKYKYNYQCKYKEKAGSRRPNVYRRRLFHHFVNGLWLAPSIYPYITY